MIELDTPKSDRVIRKMYTPREVQKIINEQFMMYHQMYDLSRDKMLLVWDFGNHIIKEFRDD